MREVGDEGGFVDDGLVEVEVGEELGVERVRGREEVGDVRLGARGFQVEGLVSR